MLAEVFGREVPGVTIADNLADPISFAEQGVFLDHNLWREWRLALTKHIQHSPAVLTVRDCEGARSAQQLLKSALGK
jgi:hypothetical protein